MTASESASRGSKLAETPKKDVSLFVSFSGHFQSSLVHTSHLLAMSINTDKYRVA